MFLSSGHWGGFLDCGSKFNILSPLSFDRPQLWRSISVCSSLYLLTGAHCDLQAMGARTHDSESPTYLRAKGARSHDSESLTYLLTLSSIGQPGVAGSSSFTLTTSLTILVPPLPLRTDQQLPRWRPGAFALVAQLSGRVQSSFGLIGEGPKFW